MTEEQEKAVSHKRGPACVIAGAGTGKTTALAERILHLVERRHFDPARILVTTFTRKATAELYRKAYEGLGEHSQQLRISTIDALIGDLARRAAERGLMRSKRLIGQAGERVLLLQSAWETFGDNSYREEWTRRAGQIDLVGLMEKCVRAEMAERREKQGIIGPTKTRLKEIRNRFYFVFDFRVPSYPELKRAAKRYFEKLEALGATGHQLLTIDFLRCLRKHRKLRSELASEFDAILVDEFQDTSDLQAEVLLLLAGSRRNIWVVGDPCQQIYEWRGAGPENIPRFIKKTKAKKYYLTGNWRSTEPILKCAYHFLGRRVPALKKKGMLKPLKSMRSSENEGDEYPVFAGTLDQALFHVKRLLESKPDLSPGDIAVLSRKLDKRTRGEIEKKAPWYGLRVQFHSSRADRALDQTIGNLPDWRPGKALDSLYRHRKIGNLISRSLRRKDFSELRTINPIASAAEALDSTLPPQAFTFREAWPALKKTRAREISGTAAVVGRPDHIQVMTIHAAKGLEFPVVMLMKLGKGSPRSFPNPRDQEDSRLVYVGATRARDGLILVHTMDKPKKTLAAFGRNLVSIRRNRREDRNPKIEAPAVASAPPIIAASHLDLYQQCPLKFAAYHEGRFLPKWTVPQSMGARLHRALEYYLRAGMPDDKKAIAGLFERGFEDGDSPLRKLPRKSVDNMHRAFGSIAKRTRKNTGKVLAVEQRYTYMQGGAGQVEGVVDAVIERRDGVVVLKEWKTSAEVEPSRRRQYELQARAGVLGMAAQRSLQVQRLEITPILRPKNTISIRCDRAFIEQSKEKLEQVFNDLKDRKYEPRRGGHCNRCQLRAHCPAHRRK